MVKKYKFAYIVAISDVSERTVERREKKGKIPKFNHDPISNHRYYCEQKFKEFIRIMKIDVV